MAQWNHTVITELMFLAFPSHPELQALFFLGITIIYAVIVTGNLLILAAIQGDSRLHTPMYFFLGALSVVELSYTAAVVPQMLASSLQTRKTISFGACGAQMFFFIGLGGADCFLLAVMAYDRYVAIWHPLHYTLIMTWQLSLCLVVASLLVGFLLALDLVVLIFSLPFCGAHGIQHFFCDVPPLLWLVCAKTETHEIAVFLAGTAAVLVPFVLICASYIFIARAVLQIRSTRGRRRAFSTCSSHLVVVVLQYGCCGFVYLRPSSSFSPEQDQLLSLVYTLGTPILNPIIYTLRNGEVKGALRKALWKPVSLGVSESH
ncbi:olfactory receptor 10W1-like [Alligator sinensis]|uniref:Olfactory receptor n=1 Tax=Alligator sinensis TaxID=38654 RepID=A0A1U7SN19_ALLSI|nr:olfactory receptor 10W1-like [Alligator sinensis]